MGVCVCEFVCQDCQIKYEIHEQNESSVVKKKEEEERNSKAGRCLSLELCSTLQAAATPGVNGAFESI